MSKELLLVGASGLAREVLSAGIADVVGILDDNVQLHQTEVGGVPVLGPVALGAQRSERLLISVGSSIGRRNVVRHLAELGVSGDRFATYLAPSARIGSTSHVGTGSILLDGVVVTANAAIGRHVVVMPNCTITHDDVLGDFSTLAAGVALGGSVCVGEAAYIGMNASVRQALVVGAGATVGMGAAVVHDVPDRETWAGVPARRLGESA
jgi:sugar O-acyltransferase (sialic acid O-acetyltransferase NeuD family)